jgi:membrane-associated phospholipid phosphatase
VINFLKQNIWFFLLYFIVLTYSLYQVSILDKVSLHYQMNQVVVGNAAIDSFFVWITYLGDGNVAAFLIAIILVFNFRNGFSILVCFALAGLATYVIKQYGFDEVNRPSFVFHFFVPDKQLKLIEGVNLHIHNSFPSGHATQAFAIFGLLSFFTTKQWQKIGLFVIALLTAYSRVHLSQHWLIDVTAGSAVGLGMALLIYFITSNSVKFNALNKPIWKLRK